MTPDISAIAQKWADKWWNPSHNRPLPLGIRNAIEAAIEEATASLRAQLEGQGELCDKAIADTAHWMEKYEAVIGERDVALARNAKYRANECEFEDSLGAQEGN